MGTNIIYSSVSGNTKQLALAIHQVIEGSTLDDINVWDYKQININDIVCVGYWIDKGDCDTNAKKMLESLTGGHVVLFGTLGAAENSTYYHMIKCNVEKHVKSPMILGHFLCQGKVGDALIQRYKMMLIDDPDNENMKQQVANYEAGLSHPDVNDLLHIQTFIKGIIKDA